ncbi:MAG TPA: mannosyltransferase family protein [Patescibacteria group bacterium]|nr:mannosyltransferase family protein [Patescibacteria group bacterium]
MKKNEIYFVIFAFLTWRLGLFLILFLATKVISLQTNFLGGGLANYLSNPNFWAWANFDGEHYLSIAQNGYGFGERAFFPLLPILIKYFGNLLGGTLFSFNIAANIISNLSFLIGLLGLYKLVGLDHPSKISKLAIIILLLFPTSFYFVSIYTESLFFMLAVWSFWFARKGKWLPASLLGILLSSVRFVGLIILPALVVEWFLQNRNNKNIIKSFPHILLTIPVGLLAYMFYLQRTAGDMFAFYNNLTIFGEQRSNHLITLPQVFYRYFIKILPNLKTLFFPIVFTTFFEFIIGILFLIISTFSFFVQRFSYAIFLFLGYLIPTFSGSFSSLPRYVIVLFPVYILTAKYLSKSKILLLAFCFISFILLVISFALFARGYWIS